MAKRGRPLKPIQKDRDRYAVALLRALMQTEQNGKYPTLYRAAYLAALAAEYNLTTFEIKMGPLDKGHSLTTGKKLPVLPSLQGSIYEETVYEPVREKEHGARTPDALVRRLMKKHELWSNLGPNETDWLSSMTEAWKIVVRPSASESLQPEQACLDAAIRVGESAFAREKMLPALKMNRLLALLSAQ